MVAEEIPWNKILVNIIYHMDLKNHYISYCKKENEER